VRKLLIAAAVAVVALVAAVASQACATHEYNLYSVKSEFDATRMRAQIDPIVSPGVPVSAHLHDFWCRIRVSANTVANSTLPVGTTSNPGYEPQVSTCIPYSNWPEFWNPTPLVGGVLAPNHTDTPTTRMVANYKFLATFRAHKGIPVLPVPYGMAVVAGNSKATSPADNPHLSWTCGSQYDGARSPVNCVGAGQVTAVVEFPDCWNQQHGWGSDGWDPSFSGKVQFDTVAGVGPANFTYSFDGQCPVGFTPIAQLVTRTEFVNPMDNSPMVDPAQLTLSSGAYWTFHVDFFNLASRFYQTLTFKCNNLMPVATVDCLTGMGATADEATA
jgi:hypothetical protein